MVARLRLQDLGMQYQGCKSGSGLSRERQRTTSSLLTDCFNGLQTVSMVQVSSGSVLPVLSDFVFKGQHHSNSKKRRQESFDCVQFNAYHCPFGAQLETGAGFRSRGTTLSFSPTTSHSLHLLAETGTNTLCISKQSLPLIRDRDFSRRHWLVCSLLCACTTKLSVH